jgi:hypothetical protein
MLEMLNGNPKCTVIERMDSSVKVIGPICPFEDLGERTPRAQLEFQNLEACKKALAERGWEANVVFVKKIVRHEE